MEQRAPDIRTALPTVAAVIDERSASAASVSQERAIADIVQFVARLAPTGLVIAIDDAQWLDSSSRAVVSGIAAAAAQSGLVVVSTQIGRAHV